MKVSIIIPTYNCEAYIKPTLECAIQQTYKNLEIIVVDANSTDSTVKQIKSIVDERIQLVELNYKSLSGNTRNEGLKIATGDFVNYLDGDDLMDLDKIERQLLLITSDRNTIATSNWTVFSERQEPQKSASELIKDFTAEDYIYEGWACGEMMPIMAYLLPMSIVKKVGKWNTNLQMNEDSEYFLRVLHQCQTVKCANNTFVHYRKEAGMSVSHPTASKINDWLLSLELMANQMKKHDTPNGSEIIANLYQNFIFQVFPKYKVERKIAQKQVQAHGGSTLKYRTEGKFGRLQKYVGWKIARRIELLKNNFKEKSL